MTKTILDAIVSFEYFCDLIKKKYNLKNLKFTDSEKRTLLEAYNHGSGMVKVLRDYGKTVKGIQALQPYLTRYH